MSFPSSLDCYLKESSLFCLPRGLFAAAGLILVLDSALSFSFSSSPQSLPLLSASLNMSRCQRQNRVLLMLSAAITTINSLLSSPPSCPNGFESTICWKFLKKVSQIPILSSNLDEDCLRVCLTAAGLILSLRLCSLLLPFLLPPLLASLNMTESVPKTK